MKRTLKFSVLVLVLALGSSLTTITNAQYNDDHYYDDRGDVTYQTFYDQLSPYGRWIDYPDYGYVWVPDAGRDFQPYSSNGHWVYTDDYEWMWVSDYDWGWAPFHYGRWDYDSYYGWIWIPGYEWSPAWVAWRDGGDYYGWAPLRPGIHISINFNIGTYSPPYNFWCFAPRRYITYSNVYNYCVPRTRNITIINQTTIINNYNYRGSIWRTGPRRVDVEIYAGRINSVRFRASSSPGRSVFRNNEVNFYRPNVRRDDDRRFAPRQFERFGNRNNDNRVGRNDNNFRRNNDRVFRNDNSNNNQPSRNNERVRQPRQFDNNNNGNTNDRRKFDRIDRNTNDRVNTPNNRPERNQNTNSGNNRFERRNVESHNSNTPSRQPQNRNFERPQRQQQPQRVEQQQRQQQPRQFERKNDGGNRQQGNNRGGNGNGNGRSRKG
ncbi:MAG TPA: hypothetical protein PKC72_10405 [Chitinophagaceae bacterium]|nr:hypothetical protein [Chitinophagaceae bacterium]